MAAAWNEEERLGSVFLNGKPKGRQNVKDGKSSYRAMNNSHSVYIIGAESKTNAESGGKTLHGFIKELKVFKRALNQSEILTETSLSNASGTFDCSVFVIIYLFIYLFLLFIYLFIMLVVVIYVVFNPRYCRPLPSAAFLHTNEMPSSILMRCLPPY